MAGARPHLPPALAAWLGAAAPGAVERAWVLRGSAVLWASCRDARTPADLDYVVPGNRETFRPDELAAAARAIAAEVIDVTATEVIWAETPTPGLRVHVAHDGAAAQIDLSIGDPMIVAPRVAHVGDATALTCALETLFAWKLHGLCEFGPGRWRAKDLFDLDLIWRTAELDIAATRAEIALAFSSRSLPQSALDDVRDRQAWGTSRSGRRKWDALRKDHPPTRPFDDTLATVRAALDALLPRP